MKATHLITVLIALTLAMQGVILYNQYYPRQPTPPPPTREAGPNDRININDVPVKGSAAAKLVLVEFSDYECPFCSKHSVTVAKDIDRAFVSTGKIQMAFINRPLPIHPNAEILAAAAICAGGQADYWEAHDVLFQEKPRNRPEIDRSLEHIIQSKEEFDSCMVGSSAKSRISMDQASADQLKIASTPTFALGFREADGKVKVRTFIHGAQPLRVFEDSIRELSQ